MLIFVITFLHYAAYADTETFLIATNANLTGQAATKFLMKDGSTFAPVGLRVQGLMNTDSISDQPAPTTNSATGTLGTHVFGVHVPVNIQEYRYKDTWIGDDDSSYFLSSLGEGEVTKDIGLSGNNSWYGWLRTFSHDAITQAAYYADSPAELLDNDDENGGYGDLIISNVNPAYIIPFDVIWPASAYTSFTPFVSIACTGKVTTGFGNNILPDSLVSVKWENITLGTSGWFNVSAGNWNGNIPLSNAAPDVIHNQIQLNVYGKSVQNSFPQGRLSSHEIVNFPEPTLFWISNFGFWFLYITKRLPSICLSLTDSVK